MARDVTHPRSKVTLDMGDGTPVVVDASSWSVQRALSGTNIPGQVRAASGVGTTDGSVAFAVDDNRTPWQAGPFLPGGKAAIDAAADADLPLSPIARLLVSELGLPGALTPERNATLTEDLGALRGQRVVLPVTLGLDTIVIGESQLLDAAYLIDAAARAGGRYQTPPPTANTLVSVPGNGSVQPDKGTLDWRSGAPLSSPFTFVTTSDGRTAMAGGVAYYTVPTITLAAGLSLYVYYTAVGGASFVLRLAQYGIAGTLTLSAAGARLGASATATMPEPPVDGRCEVQIQYVSTSVTQIRVRAADGGPWSAWVQANLGFTGNLSDYSIDLMTINAASNGTSAAIGVQLNAAEDPVAWTAPTARIAATGSLLTAVLPGDPQVAWSLIGDVASSTFGAVWIDEAGVLRFVPKESLRGMTARGADIIAETDLADLSAYIGLDDVADRVEVSYQPPDVQTSTTGSITVWEATDAVQVGAGKTVTIYADLDGAADDLAPWLPLWTTSPAVTQQSRWAAATSRDGGGTQPADTALSVSSTLVSPNRVRIQITNTTGSTLWTVDGNGNPTLTLRANVYATAGEAITISTGAPADTAVNPLSVDLGSWVQDADVAQSLLEWLDSMTSTPLPTLSDVQVVPDPTIRQGDVRVLRDPDHTGLVSKVLVAGVDIEYSGTELLSQTLKLVVLGVLNWDVALWLTPSRTNTQAAALATAALGSATTNSQAAAWYAKGAIA